MRYSERRIKMLTELFKKCKAQFEPTRCSFQRYQPIFKTTDGETHEGAEFNWVCREQLQCSIPDYLMTSIRCDGYVKDMNGSMYPLENVIKIDWNLREAQTIMIKTCLPRFKIFYTENEFKKLGGL